MDRDTRLEEQEESEATAGKETVSEAGSEAEEEPTGEGKEPVKEKENEFEEEVKKRGAKNVILENKRKSDEIAQLKKEFEDFKLISKAKEFSEKPAEEPEEIRSYKNRMLERGYDEEFVKDQVDTMLKIAARTADYLMKPTERFIYRGEFDRQLVELKKVPKYKIVLDKYEGEVMKELEQQNISPKYWGNEEILKALIGQITLDHADDLFGKPGKTKIVEEVPTETSGSTGGKGEGGISDAELRGFADEYNLDLSTSENKLKAKKAYLSKKKALNQLKKEEE
jgi:hypothetical protein